MVGMNVKPSDIKLYPMTMDVRGERTHEQYVDAMAKWLVSEVIGYRLDYAELRKLVDYAEQNHDRLNKY